MTWDQVQDQLDLPALAALNKYWQRLPPLHVMVAAYFGIKDPAETSDAPAMSEADIGALIASIPQVQR